MSERFRSMIIYSGKCAAGSFAVFIISHFLRYIDVSWALISVMLVLSPDGKDSLTLAITRIKANFVGVTVAIGALLISPANMWILSCAIVAALCLCYIFKLDAGIRSSLAATIIIMLHPAEARMWDTALERIIAVLTGCIIALLVTYTFHFKQKLGRKEIDISQQEA